MKIYDETKTQILENPDLELGYLKHDTIVIETIPASPEVQEVFHYEYKEYKNNKGEVYGRDRFKIIDTPYQPAVEEHDVTEEIQVYVLYTEEELIEMKKSKLRGWRETMFDIIDCAVWYDTLTDEEKQEVKDFRLALLDITITMEKPNLPECVKARTKENEDE